MNSPIEDKLPPVWVTNAHFGRPTFFLGMSLFLAWSRGVAGNKGGNEVAKQGEENWVPRPPWTSGDRPKTAGSVIETNLLKRFVSMWIFQCIR